MKLYYSYTALMYIERIHPEYDHLYIEMEIIKYRIKFLLIL
jgi:hypothetical protein